MPPPSFSLRLRNELDELDRLNARVAEFVEAHQLHPQVAFTLDLVIEEMLTNTIKYGYDDPGPHDLDVRIELQPPHLLVHLEDDGHPFDPRAAPEPPKGVPLRDMKIGGLGIHLVRNMTARLDYRRENDRNILDILIPLEPPPNG
jgi:anti-sigma regulatory factor (Ser/Thr protein kinase)